MRVAPWLLASCAAEGPDFIGWERSYWEYNPHEVSAVCAREDRGIWQQYYCLASAQMTWTQQSYGPLSNPLGDLARGDLAQLHRDPRFGLLDEDAPGGLDSFLFCRALHQYFLWF